MKLNKCFFSIVVICIYNCKWLIGYYTYRIIKDLIELDEKNEYFLFSNCELSVNFPLKKNVHFILLPFKSRLLWSRYILGIKTKKYKLDVFWSPTHNLPIVQQRNTKYFMTVHDIANHILPNISQSKDNQQRYLRVILNSSCKTADSIIVPSLATKNDLVDYFKVKEDKIKVVYEGGDAEKSIRPIDKKELVDKYKITKPYFLYIGTLQPRKNIETIVDAFERLNNSNVQLVLAGGIGWGKVTSFIFRDKSVGWGLDARYKYKRKGKVKSKRLYYKLSSFYNYYEKAINHRENCYYCKYSCESRVGDITLGDFWGVEKNQPDCLCENGGTIDERAGVSFCLINSTRGIELFDRASEFIDYVSSDFKIISMQNDNLLRPTAIPNNRKSIMELYRNEGYEAKKIRYSISFYACHTMNQKSSIYNYFSTHYFT